MEQFSQHQLVYIDETGIDVYLYREKGRALKGEKVKAKISGRRYQRLSLGAAQVGKKLIAPMTYTGTMISDLFESWFRDFLLPLLTKKSVIIMDNARFHRMRALQDFVAANRAYYFTAPTLFTRFKSY